ncbi:MAG: hypothetical protein AAFO95_22125, partial [Cyanobacteria bacterium J06600_6]
INKDKPFYNHVGAVYVEKNNSNKESEYEFSSIACRNEKRTSGKPNKPTLKDNVLICGVGTIKLPIPIAW